MNTTDNSLHFLIKWNYHYKIRVGLHNGAAKDHGKFLFKKVCLYPAIRVIYHFVSSLFFVGESVSIKYLWQRLFYFKKKVVKENR